MVSASRSNVVGARRVEQVHGVNIEEIRYRRVLPPS